MTRKKALELVNQVREFAITEEELPYSPATLAAVNDLECISLMTRRQGGELQSRQLIATIVFLAEKSVRDSI